MIVTCPECEARFLLPAQSLGAEGRKVKCSSCGHIWFQKADEEEIAEFGGETETTEKPAGNDSVQIDDVPDAVRPVADDEGSRMPVIRDDDSSKSGGSLMPALVGYACAAMVFLLIAFVLVLAKRQVLQIWPASAAIYQLAGIEVPVPGEGLVFDKVTLTAEDGDGGTVYTVRGQIINLKPYTERVPMIEAELLDADNTVVDRWNIESPVLSLAAESAETFEALYISKTQNAEQLRLGFVPAGQKKFSRNDEEDGADTPAPHADDHAH